MGSDHRSLFSNGTLSSNTSRIVYSIWVALRLYRGIGLLLGLGRWTVEGRPGDQGSATHLYDGTIRQ